MRPSALAAFLPFSISQEGELPYLYLDALGYVTTGIGNLAEPVSVATALPWVNPDGSASTAAEITEAWNAVDAERSDPKGQLQTSGLATHYGQAFSGVTSIRLTQEGINALFARQLTANEAELRKYFPAYDELPADVQMGLNSMAWALGNNFPPEFPVFTKAVNAWDFTTAAANDAFRGTGVAGRIAADTIMFQNGAAVVAGGLDPDVLYYPGRASGSASSSTSLVPAVVGSVVGLVVAVLLRLRGVF